LNEKLDELDLNTSSHLVEKTEKKKSISLDTKKLLLDNN